MGQAAETPMITEYYMASTGISDLPCTAGGPSITHRAPNGQGESGVDGALHWGVRSAVIRNRRRKGTIESEWVNQRDTYGVEAVSYTGPLRLAGPQHHENSIRW